MVKEAVAEAGIDANVEHITDIRRIAEYGVFSTPSVVVDGRVKSVGRIPKKEEVMMWLGK
jgi:small redox-active disulfide protein 2